MQFLDARTYKVRCDARPDAEAKMFDIKPKVQDCINDGRLKDSLL